VKRHKWGIFWLVMLAWNGESLGGNLNQCRYWWALLAFVTAVMCAVMAYRDLTKPRVGSVTITITPDTRAFDAAMKRAQRTKP
jgi:hypothetical protein